MKTKWIALAADFLHEYADRLGNDGCNDWWFPDDWTQAERDEIVMAMHSWNGDPDEAELPAHKIQMNNFLVPFLADQLKDHYRGEL